ncbi:AI-2E family transporter [Holospora curviuscula]|uniref:Pheromone autoinducer 2 transporter n=1 Tax=Holospora curviuscula TaxID=1082868 RepID=A0A2S5RHY5_9PROT|nr:AI-2E family transporter [Holospora curviuscula]PPE06944.1 hypothetical protein HCUR_00006 [Holospora curviuscula]
MTKFEKQCLSVGIFGILATTLYWTFSALIPFIAAFVWAYLWRPILLKAQNYNIASGITAFSITFLTYFVLAATCIVLIPSVKHLLVFLFQNLSLGKEEILNTISLILKKIHISPQGSYWIERTLEEGLSITTIKLKEIMFYVLQSGLNAAKIVTIIAMAPFLSFYIMKDWASFVNTLISWIPIPYRKSILKGLEQVHLTFSAYLRGQALVCISLCGYYAITLNFFGLQFGWLIGVLIGFFSFIPYLSVFIGICVSFLIALLTSTAVSLKILTVIFVIGYGLEALFLTPFLIGKRIGLHPTIVLLAIFSLGHAMGIIGILLSAPLTAIVVACIRLVKEYYLKSIFYRGTCG